MNNLEYFVPFSPQELCLEVCLKLFVHYEMAYHSKNIRGPIKTFQRSGRPKLSEGTC